MSDLVERLRDMLPLSEACGTMDEAADRIEALEAALRVKVRCPHDMGFDNELGPIGCRLVAQELECVCEYMHFARAALTPEQKP